MRWPLLLLPAFLSAQEPVRVTTRLVEVGVIAETKKGGPILDLSREELTLLDGGREEKILFFTAGSRGSPAEAGETLVGRILDLPGT
jgi:hypothetical protein